MNEVIKALQERRSIRSFTPEPVSDGDLKHILESAIFAPSARNTQPWHITAICNTTAIDRLTSAVKAASAVPGFDAYKAFVGQDQYTINHKGGTVFIIVAVDFTSSFSPEPDGALAMLNMMLAAHSLGLGSCWINQLNPICDEPGFRKILTELGIPETHKVTGCLVLGHPAIPNPAPPARRPQTLNIVR